MGVNTSPDYVNPTGKLTVVDLATKSIIQEIELPGQPDAIDVSKDSSVFPMYLAVAIENERDEDLGDGAPPRDAPLLFSRTIFYGTENVLYSTYF